MAFNVPRLPELRVHAERDDDLGLVYASGTAPTGVPPFRFEQCLDHPLCLPDAALSVWPRLNAEIYRARADPRIVLRTNSIALILDFVAAGRGVSFLNWLDVALGVERGELRFAHLVNRRLSDRLYLVTATNAPPRPETLKLLTNLYRALPSPPERLLRGSGKGDRTAALGPTPEVA
jgi:DNA-binding transcriptional LysR family regulator